MVKILLNFFPGLNRRSLSFPGVLFWIIGTLRPYIELLQIIFVNKMKRASESSPLNKFNKSINRTDLSPKRSAQKPHTVYNQDKLKVFIKFKPNNGTENSDGDQVRFVNEHQIQVKTALKNKMYQFDHVFNGYQAHLQVFQIGCKDIIDHVFIDTYEKNHGNNGLIFVYGNTGTGKTYSMGLLNMINSESQGIVPNSLRYIFQTKQRKCYQNFSISISFCEVYMDEVYDLLDFQSEAKLTIREDSKTKQPFLQNETTIAINSVEQAFQIINIGLEKRRVAEQKMNRKSSRGHGLITIHLSHHSGDKEGKICFIDLAGCERLKDSESKGVTLNEALHINSSLSALQTLLMNISDQNVRNYRASKLTRILQPYIQFGKIHLFVTSTGQSINAVEFAKRCKGIKFMQRQLRSSTPIKRSNITQKGATKNSKELEQLIQFRRESIQREKKLVSCIVNLTVMIKRISETLEQTFRGQTLHNKFSFSQIINNAELQNKINAKIKQYQTKEQKIIEYNLQKLEKSNLIQMNVQQIAKILEQPQQLISEAYDHTHDLINAIKAFGIFAEYKNVYKKQFFTCELKFNLLEDKCKNYEHNIYGLMKFVNIADKRAVKKLKEMGIPLGKQNIQNIHQIRNRSSRSKSITKGKENIKKAAETDSFEIHQSERRSAIYIDEF